MMMTTKEIATEKSDFVLWVYVGGAACGSSASLGTGSLEICSK
jgi:hypothetical protein